ncbi:glutaminase A [Leifsonia sp. ZF2019]|uniref:glutaminase A n=1 Tax=Leifsonia sp. ZF2019 TaxID=2781978 RepID=UPI001CBC50C3|nr:glutaminase A [Leifsonia sp. ZF2019]UAJ79035.1 glutaminase A [Leifsonia sp. ZF2019]
MFETDTEGIRQEAATGALPARDRVEQLVRAAHERYRGVDAGSVADYIPALAEADHGWFGICVADTAGGLVEIGDTGVPFSIQSISKAFVYALVCDAFGHERIGELVGVDNTGLPFNSVIALELNGGHPMNPMVNAGAIATTALVAGETADAKWETIARGLARFAGRDLEVDDRVFTSESETNSRNQAIARLLQSYGRLDGEPGEIVEVYTRQCSLLVTARDIAIMGATLADGGVNPVTGERVVSEEVSRDTLAVLAANGLYERSGEWLFQIGLPAKSGVSGGIVSIAPGKGAIGTFAPPLDAAGNSVRGERATAYLSRTLGLNLFASAAVGASAAPAPASTPAPDERTV